MTSNKKLVLASSNQGKLAEFNALLKDCGYLVVPQQDFGVPDAEETGLTFVENAILKARNACQHTHLPAIADDSGIEVDALLGKPGIYSARFSGANATNESNNQKLLESLKDVAPEARTARYQCILVLMQHAEDPVPIICQASWEGIILPEPSGDGGFGYDPLFFVPTHNCSAAQMAKEEKNRISHRGKALQQLLQKLSA